MSSLVPDPVPAAPLLSRRQLAIATLDASVALLALTTLSARDALAEPLRSDARTWLRALGIVSGNLRGGRLSPSEWRERAEALARQVDVTDVLRHIDFDRLAATPMPTDAPALSVTLPADDGTPEELPFVAKIFGLERGRSAIIPHGHANMVSMHLVAGGEFRLRQYDRIADEPDALVLAPVIDRTARRGDASAIADAKGNVHWFVPQTARAFTFDIIVIGLDRTAAPSTITFVDAGRATPAPAARLRARKMSLEAALAEYATRTS